MIVSNPLSAVVNLVLSLPQLESASLVPAHVNSAKQPTALNVSSKMFAVLAARKYGVSKPPARPTAIAMRSIKTAAKRRTHNASRLSIFRISGHDNTVSVVVGSLR